ncbi:hypothetical protein D3C76_48130 [compost metagenome]
MSRGGSEQARARAQAGRQSQGGLGLDIASERVLTTVIERVLSQRLSEQAKQSEKVQVLLGERGEYADSAVRRGDLQLDLKRLPQATAAPTMDQYNALVDAYNGLIVALADIARK